jgi:hypothetical protein
MSTIFWLLDAPPAQQFAEEANDSKHDPIICPIHASHRSGVRRIGNLSIVVRPSAMKDFVWSWSTDILISEKILGLFKKHQVTGYETAPVKVVCGKASDAPPAPLRELIVTGWGGAAAAAAGVKLIECCPACGHRYYTIAEPSLLIDETAWDGSDLFIVWPLPKYRFVSDRLAHILRSEKISGIKLIPAADIPMKKGARVGPGSLSYWMPEARARELGDPFGIS